MREEAITAYGKGTENADPASGDGAGAGETSCVETVAAAEKIATTKTSIKALTMLTCAISEGYRSAHQLWTKKRKIKQEEGRVLLDRYSEGVNLIYSSFGGACGPHCEWKQLTDNWHVSRLSLEHAFSLVFLVGKLLNFFEINPFKINSKSILFYLFSLFALKLCLVWKRFYFLHFIFLSNCIYWLFFFIFFSIN